jgi:hypothetical protein
VLEEAFELLGADPTIPKNLVQQPGADDLTCVDRHDCAPTVIVT